MKILGVLRECVTVMPQKEGKEFPDLKRANKATGRGRPCPELSAQGATPHMSSVSYRITVTQYFFPSEMEPEEPSQNCSRKCLH